MLLLLKIGIGLFTGLFVFMLVILVNLYLKQLKAKKQLKKNTLLAKAHEEIKALEVKEETNKEEEQFNKLSQKAKNKFFIFNEIFPRFNYKKYKQLKYGISIGLFLILWIILGFIFAVLAFIMGIFIPDYIANKIWHKNLNRFEIQLIDGLTLVANALKSGASFNQAIDVMIKETKAPLSSHFAKFLNETRMGSSVEDALDNMAKRVKSEELNMVVISINVARQAGGNLSEILLHTANTIRERERIKGKVEALTAQGKMSGYVISALPMLLLGALYKIDPLMVAPMFNTLIGNVVLVLSGVMILMGSLWIKKIVNIDF